MSNKNFNKVLDSNDSATLKTMLSYLLDTVEYTALSYEGLAELETDTEHKNKLLRIAKEVKEIPKQAYKDYLKDLN